MYSKVIIWMIGQQLAGKTSLANCFQSYGVSTLNIGETLRKRHTIQQFLKSENPFAPKFAETDVQYMIVKFLDDNIGANLCVVDSAPRNPEQFEIMLNYRDVSQIMLLKQPYELRRRRALLKYNGDLTYFDEREKHEQKWFSYVEAKLQQLRMHVMRVGAI